MELDVLGQEAVVAGAYVEREQRRPSPEKALQLRNHRMRARARVRCRRAEIERVPAARIGRVEVPAPRLDHRERAEVVQRDDRGAVTAGGQSDKGAPAPVRDRPEVRVDVVRQLARERGLPVAAYAPVEVFRIAVSIPGALRRDDDRAPPRCDEDALEPGRHPSIRARTGRKAVQEVDDRIACVRRRVSGRECDLEVQRAVQSTRVERALDGRPDVGGRPGGGRCAQRAECSHDESDATHRLEPRRRTCEAAQNGVRTP